MPCHKGFATSWRLSEVDKGCQDYQELNKDTDYGFAATKLQWRKDIIDCRKASEQQILERIQRFNASKARLSLLQTSKFSREFNNENHLLVLKAISFHRL